MIPTHDEYTLTKWDGTVTINGLQYPILPQENRTSDLVWTSEYSNTIIPKNYMVNLTYHCGSGREFKISDSEHSPTLSMTCQWDKTWTPSSSIDECDWVSCLKPPLPPPSRNLRVSDWDGETIPFGEQIRFVCKRGHKFEEDPEQVDVKYTCQDGSNNEYKDKRGFFDVPEKEEDWPRCVAAPLCPKPPDVMADGVKEYLPIPIPLTLEKTCALSSEDVKLTCPSFLIMYITKLTYGRNRSSEKVLCDGDRPNDLQKPHSDCFNETFNTELKNQIALECHGGYSCSVSLPTVPLDPACDGMKREARIEHICVECSIKFDYIMDTDCIEKSLLRNFWSTPESVAEMSETEKKSLLMEKLGKYYNSEVHSSLDLSMREISGDKGSLCGLAATYQAAFQTILSKSELKQLSFDETKERLGQMVSMDASTTKKTFDSDLLEPFYNEMCLPVTSSGGRKKRSSVQLDEEDFNNDLMERIEKERYKRETETELEVEMRSYGSQLRYECGLARRFYDPEAEVFYDERWMTCNWNQTWTKVDYLDECIWTQCLNPPLPPEENLLDSTWDANPVEFGNNVSFVCGEDLYFLWDRDMAEFNVSCLDDGTWEDPAEWPVCVPCKFYHL